MTSKHANNAASKLASGISASDLTIVITPGDGAKFPVMAAGDWHAATLQKVDGTIEIVRVTARFNDTFTVTRAQEGTAATTFSINDRFELRLTRAMLDNFHQKDGDIDAGGHKVSGVASATDNDDAPNKGQMDTAISSAITNALQNRTNGAGNRTVSTAAPAPTDGADGDIWYQVN